MWTAWLLGLFFASVTIAFHYEVMRELVRWAPRLSGNRRRRTVLAVLVLFMAHVLEIWWFAIAHYASVEWFDIGRLEGEFSGAIREYAYYSAITYTTVGYGDVIPKGEIRIVAGLEALTGLLTIAWSAAFTVFFLERLWARESKMNED